MSASRTALFVGLLLGLVVAFGTFTQFLLVVLFGAAGLLVGRVLEGKLDLSELVGRGRRRPVTTIVRSDAPAARPAAGAAERGPAQDPALAERGTLTVPSSVVAKIAAQAAWELDAVGAASGGVLGLGARRDFERRPTADARIYGRAAVIELDLGVAYPAPLRRTADRIRAHVTARVRDLTGLDVEQVDVKISWLHPAGAGGSRGALL